MAKLWGRIQKRYADLDLLPEYFKLAATRWQFNLWGASILAVLWGLHFIVGNPPAWVNWVAVTVALFFAGYYLWRIDHVRLVPKIAVRSVGLQHTLPRDYGGVLETRTFVQILPRCLTEAPAYECRGYLRELRRWCPIENTWETLDLRALMFRWDHAGEEQITQQPGVEKALNVVYIRHHDRQVFPVVFGDLTLPRILNIFRRRPGGAEAYRFDIQITYSDRIDGKLVSLAPLQVRLEVQLTNDPAQPIVELIEPNSSSAP